MWYNTSQYLTYVRKLRILHVPNSRNVWRLYVFLLNETLSVTSLTWYFDLVDHCVVCVWHSIVDCRGVKFVRWALLIFHHGSGYDDTALSWRARPQNRRESVPASFVTRITRTGSRTFCESRGYISSAGGYYFIHSFAQWCARRRNSMERSSDALAFVHFSIGYTKNGCASSAYWHYV